MGSIGPFANLLGVLRHDDILTANFANGSRATLVGIDRYRAETGLATDWRMLIPDDSPTSLGLTRRKGGL